MKRGQKVPMLILTIENFLDIHGIATKSSDFPRDLLGNKILEKKLSQGYHLLPWQHDTIFHQILP